MFQFSPTPEECSVTVSKDCIRILVIGDKDVGKSSFVHLICHGEVLRKASPTVGCNLDVSVHL